MSQITVSQLDAVMQHLTGLGVAELQELHISTGRITYITVPHKGTAVQTVGQVLIVPDPEPEEVQDVAQPDVGDGTDGATGASD